MIATSVPSEADSRQPTRYEFNRTDSSAPQRYPIFIGVSGKRIFDKTDVKADCAIAEALADRFRAPNAAPVRTTFGVSGKSWSSASNSADLIAAEVALQIGRNWGVAAILPFARPIFEEDFQPSLDENLEWRDRYERHARTFERVLGPPDHPNPRVLVRELPGLLIEGGGVATLDRISRLDAQHDRTLRRNHYEQVGQFIAEISTIMIAVMGGDEQPEISEANGGTARIVAYRRVGCPDAAGTAVARRSAVLRGEWPQVKPLPAGYVWLMDPQRTDSTERYPIKVLPPILDRLVEDVYAGHPGEDRVREHETYTGPLRRLTNGWRAMASHLGGDDPESRAASRQLRASLAVARGFERYHSGAPQTASSVEAAVNLSPIANVLDALNGVREKISSRQHKVSAAARRDFKWLAFMFVVAVTIFEIFAKFFHESSLWLGLYLIVLFSIGFKAWRAHSTRRGAVAEDYRAVAEILRVQRAWWSAGLTARVDRQHLQGVDQDLAPVRDCARTIIAWILLRHGWKDGTPMRDWAHVRGTAAQPRNLHGEKKSPDNWIGSQLWYFANKGEDRERWAHIFDAVSWCLFFAAGVLATVLWIWLAFPNTATTFEYMARFYVPSWAMTIGFDTIFLLWAPLAVLVIGFRALNHDIHRGPGAVFLTAVFGLLAAIGFALAFVSAGRLITDATGIHDEHRAATIVIAGLVVLTAIAGALRYLIERLNIEAEALEYRDARRRFERAERRLARDWDTEAGGPAHGDAQTFGHWRLSALSG
jgi:hypothetical protein